MDNKPRQIFYTPSRRRWYLFRNTLLAIGGICIIILAIGIWAILQSDAPVLPRLIDKESSFQRLTRQEQANDDQLLGLPKGYHPHKPGGNPHEAMPVRAGFYVNWDAQSYQTLQQHISQLNMVMPEWFFVGNQGELQVDIDPKADSLLKAHPQVAVIPMISNFYQGKWRSKNVHRLMNDSGRRHQFIQQVMAMLEKHHYQGVNIDFEELRESGDETLITFLRELSTTLHARHYQLSIDVAPLNEDYNLSALSPLVDHVILMAYDQHFSTSPPGPVSPYPWVEYVLEQTCKQLPAKKVILGIAAYGYDWPSGGEGVDITYEQAVSRASRTSATPVQFDNHTYNLSFRYRDEDNRQHSVWFTDAATTYNVVRVSEDYQTGGTAIWRLGSEDSRIWSFYKRMLTPVALQQQPFNWKQLNHTPALQRVDFEGEGEIIEIGAAPHPGNLKLEYNTTDQLISEETYVTLPKSYMIRKAGAASKTVVLSFDDGPDATYTPQILAILEREHVPAIFFVTGINAERNLPLLRRMANLGYEIGNHSTLHPNLSEVSPDRLFWELNTCRRIIESITGHSTILFRPPYNADAEPDTPQELAPLINAQQLHYYTISESIDPQDWQQGVTAQQILARIKQQQRLGNTILLHDAGGDRSATVAALPQIIRYYKQRGYHFATVGELMHWPHQQVMPRIAGKPIGLVTDQVLVYGFYYGQQALIWIFLLGTCLAIIRISGIGLLAWRQSRQEALPSADSYAGLVSIIVPAYNEEASAVRTVESLLASDYPKLEVIFVDDGSKDNTCALMRDRFETDERVCLLTKANGGKASALNYGIGHAHGEVIVCIDADTLLKPDAVHLLANRLMTEGVGAVAGNVQVGNVCNMLTRFQAIEYITSQNFDRRSYTVLNCITVIPGAIGAFRREVLDAVGGFMTDTLAEDCDLTIRILRAGYRVDTCNAAVAVTEAPETIPMLFKQRVRWCYGILQTLWKHRDLFFRRNKNGVSVASIGFFAFPSLLFFQFLFPLLTLVADFQLLLAGLTGTWHVVLSYFLAFLLLDWLIACFAFWLEGNAANWRLLGWLLPQRLLWRYLMFAVLLRSYGNTIRGEFASWGFLKRTGRVQLTSQSA